MQEFKSVSQLWREKKKKKHDDVLILGKDKLNTIEVLISKALINSYIGHGEFFSVNNVLIEYHEIKKEIKETYCVSCKKHTANENSSVRKTKENRLMIFALFGARKNRFLLKVKNVQMFSLKWIKWLTNFDWLESNLCQNFI